MSEPTVTMIGDELALEAMANSRRYKAIRATAMTTQLTHELIHSIVKMRISNEPTTYDEFDAFADVLADATKGVWL